MDANVAQSPSPATRVLNWFTALPLVTKSIFAACVCATALAAGIGGSSIAHLCLNAYFALWRLQIYRMLTSIFLHNGVLHLGLNMLAFVPMAKSLEHQLGSIFLMYLVTVIGLIASSFYMLSSALFDRFISQGGQSCALGISGVIFGLIVVETATSRVQLRSIFGFFTVPAQYYPLVLLGVCQLILPHVSFWGHLGGIIAGQLLVMGALNFIVPSPSRLQAMENERPFRSVSLWSSFVQNTSTGPIFSQESTLPVSFGPGVGGGQQNTRPTWQDLWSRAQFWRHGNTPTRSSSVAAGSRDSLQTSHSAPGGIWSGEAGVPRRVDPKTAAAQAAEARYAKTMAQSTAYPQGAENPEP